MRQGTNNFKVLAGGGKAVFIGRLVLWGLGGFKIHAGINAKQILWKEHEFIIITKSHKPGTLFPVIHRAQFSRFKTT